MGWLVADDHVLATADFAESWRDRLRGLVGRDELDGVLVLQPAKGVHTFGVQFPIDVAFCDANLRVVRIVTMRQNRIGMPSVRGCIVIEAPKGSFERWGVQVGDELELRR